VIILNQKKFNVILFFIFVFLGFIFEYCMQLYNFSMKRPKDKVLLIIWVLVGLYSIIFSVIYIVRFLSSKIAINKARKLDKAWDTSKIKKYAEELFLGYHNIVKKRKLGRYKNSLSREFHQKIVDIIESMGCEVIYKFSAHDIEIEFVRINDSIDNNKDCFAVCVCYKGRKYYSNSDGNLLRGSFDDIKHRELYFYKRSGNKWLLNNVIEEVGIFEILFLR